MHVDGSTGHAWRWLVIDGAEAGGLDLEGAIARQGLAAVRLRVSDEAGLQLALQAASFDALVWPDARAQPELPPWLRVLLPGLELPLLLVVRPEAEAAALALQAAGAWDALAVDRLHRLPASITQHRAAGRPGAGLHGRAALRDQFAKVLETVPGLICSFRLAPDGHTSMPFASARIEQFYGVDAATVKDDMAPVYRLIHPDDMASVQSSIEASARTMSPWRCEFRVLHPRRGERWLEGHSMPVREADGSLLWHGFVNDVTERRHAAAELERHRDLLEQRVAARTAQLADERQRAERANQAKSVFLANMSHEIRTPLNAVLGLTHLLQRDSVTPGQASRLEKIDAAGRHLLSIINDVLDLSKIEAGKLELQQEDFHLSMVLDHVMSLVAESARAKGLRLEMDPNAVPTWLRGDATRLRQALLNFAGNAVKFTERGGIALRAKLLDDVDGELLVRFEVQDSGPGLDPEQQQRVFDAFEQADPSITRRHGGTGLGLTITRRLAVAMGGEAGVRSVPGQGSTFWFTARLRRGHGVLPAPRARVADAEQELRSRHAGARVLLAEDNEINREVALELLHGLKFQVDVAVDGRQAVAMAGERAYDLILLDMHMPELDGLQAARAIRAMPAHRRTPVLAMTANAFIEDRLACLAAGMDDHISKPVDPRTLCNVLLAALGRDTGAAPVSEAPLARVLGPTDDDKLRLHRLQGLAGLDLDAGLRNVGDNAELLLRLLPMFSERHRHDAQHMSRCLRGGDTDGVRHAAHALKGAAAQLGAASVRDASEQLELALHAGAGAGRLQAGIDRLDGELRSLIEPLDELLRV